MRPLLVLIVTTTLAAQVGNNPPRPPDSRQGNLDGYTAALVWPARYTTSAKTPNYLDPTGCQAYLVPRTDLDSEEVHPCGQWFRPKPGQYKVWLEGRGVISPMPSVLRWDDTPFAGHGLINVMPVVQAGSVTLSRKVKIPAHTGFRLLSLSSQFLGQPQRAFDRRSRSPYAGTSMPAGKTIAGLFDQKSGDAVALSGTFDVQPGKTVEIEPRLPAEGTDVLVVLRRPQPPRGADIALTLATETGVQSPSEALYAVDNVYAVWHGVRGRTARVLTESSTLHLPAIDLSLKPRTVVTFRGDLRARPSVGVSAFVPPEKIKTLELEVQELATRKALFETVLTAGTRKVIEALPATKLRFLLKADIWKTSKEVDLTSGDDDEVTFQLSPIRINGTLYSGTEAAKGKLRFEYARDQSLEVETDERGDYEAVVLHPAVYTTSIVVANDSAPPFVQFVDIDRDRRIDFTIPTNRITIVVRDANTGAPVPGAEIRMKSVWADDTRGDMTLNLRYRTDSAGHAVLPHLHPGGVTLSAVAAGYEDSTPQTLAINADTVSKEELLLRPIHGRPVRIVLPNGEAAAGAEVAVVRDGNGSITWRGSADPSGSILLPHHLGAVFVVRHPLAGSVAGLVHAVDADIRLASPVSPSLVFQTADADGNPVAFALLTFWINGVRLTDAAVSFAGWSGAGVSDQDGIWTGRNLPKGPVRVLATRNISPVQVSSGAYDSLSSVIEPVRPDETIKIRIVR